MEAVKIELDQPVVVMELRREMDEELRHWFLGQALKRIRKFCEVNNCDGDPLIMSREVEKDFAKDKDHDFLIVVAVKNMTVVGHLLVDSYKYHGHTYATVVQFGLDEKVSLEQEEKAFGFVLNWAKEIKASGLKAIVEKPALMMWYSKFGFTRRSTIMEWRQDNGRR